MTSRIKLLGRMDVVEKRRPLDGRIKTRAGGQVKCACRPLPTAFGEKMVMRIFDPDNVRSKSLDQLGFTCTTPSAGRTLIKQPHGIILVTGPTGSGQDHRRSTRRSSAWRPMRVNVCTIEDPIK